MPAAASVPDKAHRAPTCRARKAAALRKAKDAKASKAAQKSKV